MTGLLHGRHQSTRSFQRDEAPGWRMAPEHKEGSSENLGSADFRVCEIDSGGVKLMVSKTSRRAFLATIGGLAVGVLAACQQAAAPASKPAESKPAEAAKPAEAPKPTAPAAIVPPTAAPAAPAQASPAATSAPAAA